MLIIGSDNRFALTASRHVAEAIEVKLGEETMFLRVSAHMHE
jgi:hypothetical protein